MPQANRALREYAAFLEREHLDELAALNLGLARELDVPILRLFDGVPEDVLLANTRLGLQQFLHAVQEGTAEQEAVQALRLWEADQLPGVPKEAIDPSDLVLGQGAQRQALLSFLDRYGRDQQDIVLGLERIYGRVLDASFQIYARLRRDDAERLRSDKTFIETIVMNTPASIAYLAPDLRIRWANPALGRLVGKEPAELTGKPLAEVFPAMPWPNPRIVQALATRRPVGAEGYKLQLDGTTLYTDHTYVPMLDGHGEVEGLLLLALNVTSRVESDRMKDQFLSILSHELRTPINAIMGFGSILEDEISGPLNAQQADYLHKIMGGAETLMALVSDLLDMSRIQAGKFRLDPRPLRLPEVMDEVAAYLQPLADQKHQRLEAKVDPELPVLVADEQRVAQILTNLVGNAIKFTPEGGTIQVRAYDLGDKIRCEVTDTGIGIAAADLGRLFQRFTQLDSSSTRKVGGTGLGLSISKALVEAHGGQIGVESQPGVGSTFWFELPLTPVATPA